MSISSIQKKRAFEQIYKVMYASGERPTLTSILKELSAYFSEYQVGRPIEYPRGYSSDGLRSNADDFNFVQAIMSHNIDVAYEACEEQLDQLLELTTLLRVGLERLEKRRRSLTSKIDDYMFSLFNSDGYFYSVSDTFSDTTLSDLSLTSAYVDTDSGTVSIPIISNLTNTVSPERIIFNKFYAVANNKSVPFEMVSPFSGCVDGLTNTHWATEVQTSEPTEVIVALHVKLARREKFVRVSRIEFDPFGVEPAQIFVNTSSPTRQTDGQLDRGNLGFLKDRYTSGYPVNQGEVDILRPETALGLYGETFGERVYETTRRVTFTDDARDVDSVVFIMRKTKPDFIVERNGIQRCRYIFGAKDIKFIEQVYDRSATFVSAPISLPSEISTEDVIDAVALVASEAVPTDTKIEYFIAPDVDSDSPTVEEFNWTPIVPLNSGTANGDTIVRLDGALTNVRYLKRTASTSSGEIEIIPLDTEANNLSDRNPTSIEGIPESVYRLVDFTDDFIPNSITLEEGINSTRILFTGRSADAIAGLSYWRPYVENYELLDGVTYGSLDRVSAFFDGADIGEDNKSVYVETYLECDTDREILQREIRKITEAAKQWAVRVYLNGRELVYLPVGTDTAVVPWKFMRGMNHIVLLIDIPRSTAAMPTIFNGTIDLLSGDRLSDFGTVKLDTWTYADFFHFKYNETSTSKAFTIHNGEIISRAEPTDNFRIKYSQARSSAPSAIRLRADLSRNETNQYVTPLLDSYRLRFLYA